MGGLEKPLQLLHGLPLVQHVRDRLAPQVGRVIISANRERDRYAEFGHDVVRDTYEDLGPLGGLGSVAALVRTPWIFCCPGDAPLLDRSLVRRLAASVSPEHDGVFPHDGERAQHLFLLVRTSCCTTIDAQLAAGHRSIHAWRTTLRVQELPMPELSASFRNVNTLDELAQLHAEGGATRRTPDRPADTWPPRRPR
jgi:molybdopterin-guanine dinucleotide biosynthesis protein A